MQHSVEFLSAESYNVPERHRSMQAVFDATWQRLTPAEQGAFGQLSIFRGGFSQEAAAQIAGLSLQMLRKLVARSLIQFEPSARRYRIHELLRQFGERMLMQTHAQHLAVLERHSSYYCELLERNFAGLQGEAQHSTLALLDQEGENLRLAWEWTIEQGRLDSLARAVDTLGYFYEWTGRHDEGATVFDAAVAALERRADTLPPATRLREQARCMAWSGLFGYLLGRRETPRASLQRAIEILDRLEAVGQDVRLPKATTLRHLGRLLQWIGVQEAIAALSQSLDLAQAGTDPWEAAVTSVWLGYAYRYASQYDRAAAHLNQALDFLKGQKERYFTALALEELAKTLRFQGRYEESLHLGEGSLALRREIGDRYGVASSLLMLDEAYYWLGRLPLTPRLTEEAIAIYSQLGDRAGLCRGYGSLAIIYVLQGEYERATAILETSTQLAKELGNQRWEGRCLWITGLALLGRGDYLQAHGTLRESVAALERVGISTEVGWAYGSYAYSAWKLGEPSLATRLVASALRNAIQHNDATVARLALLSAALLLAPRQPQRAIELFALAWQDPLTVNAQINHDLWERDLNSVLAAMPLEEVAAAQERGAKRHLWATVEEVLAELDSLVSSAPRVIE